MKRVFQSESELAVTEATRLGWVDRAGQPGAVEWMVEQIQWLRCELAYSKAREQAKMNSATERAVEIERLRSENAALLAGGGNGNCPVDKRNDFEKDMM